MEPIQVLAVPKTSFNKHRRVSDLLFSQLKHFQHVALKQGIEIEPALAREIHTENGAARYITAVTRAIRERGLSLQKGTVAAGPQLVARKPRTQPPVPGDGVAIAAAASKKSSRKKGKPAKPPTGSGKP